MGKKERLEDLGRIREIIDNIYHSSLLDCVDMTDDAFINMHYENVFELESLYNDLILLRHRIDRIRDIVMVEEI